MCKLTFSISRIPDSNGLRIYTTSHLGVFVSSLNPDSAKKYFMHLALEYMLHRKLVTVAPGQALTLKQVPDWDQVLSAGQGDIAPDVLTIEAWAEKFAQVEVEPLQFSTHEELIVDRWVNGEHMICTARTKSPRVDEWITQTIEAELSRHAAETETSGRAIH